MISDAVKEGRQDGHLVLGEGVRESLSEEVEFNETREWRRAKGRMFQGEE